MNKQEIENKLEDIIFQKLESDSDGWQSTYNYSEVIKGMKESFNLALQLAAENVEMKTIGKGFEAEDVVDKESILKYKL